MVKQSAQLNDVFAALADPTRRAILARLAGGRLTVGELAEPFDMSLPAVSKHLRVLDSAGLVSRVRRGRTIECELRPAQLRAAADWLHDYEKFWNERLDALEGVIRRHRRRKS